MAIEDEIINITDIDVGTEILNNDKLIIETNNGTKLLAFKDLVIGEENITFKDKLVQGTDATGSSSTDFTVVTGFNILTSSTTAGHLTRYADVSGSVELGKFNYDRVAKFASLSALIKQNEEAIKVLQTDSVAWALWRSTVDTTAGGGAAAAALPVLTLSAVSFVYENGSWTADNDGIKFTADGEVVNPVITNPNVTLVKDPFSIKYPTAGNGYVASYIVFQLSFKPNTANDEPVWRINKQSADGGTSEVWNYSYKHSGAVIQNHTHIEYVSPGDTISLTSSTKNINSVNFSGRKLG